MVDPVREQAGRDMATLDQLGLKLVCILETSGFRTFWINRTGATPDHLGYQPAAVLSQLTDLPALLK